MRPSSYWCPPSLRKLLLAGERYHIAKHVLKVFLQTAVLGLFIEILEKVF